MLIIMEANCTVAQVTAVEECVRTMGYTPLPVPGPSRTAICVTGNRGPVDGGLISRLPGVAECIRVTKPYKLVGREVHPEDTVVTLGDVKIGGANPAVVIAGPCSCETEARTMAIARAALKAGATVLRAGAFKPRTSPYEFRGLGKEALVTLAKVRSELGMPVVSEVLDNESIDMIADSVDAFQVGARNMQNYSLLTALSKASKPVLLKRGLSATFEEWMLAAEYLLSGGNRNIILCERGVRTFSDHSRNTLDLNIVPVVRKFSHLPVVVDPSHGVGHRDRVRAMARAALACGAQGLLVEAHTNPATSYTDADQTIDMETLAGIVRDRDFLAGIEKV
ncbi:MAG TPA: 3-deoxy-7-phosphoheptulonate synthase [Opitutaceae bacterium]